MNPQLGVEVNLTELYDMCEKHDWIHMTDPDQDRYQAGADFYTLLMQAANQSPEHKALFNKYERWAWGRATGTETDATKPVRPVSATVEINK